MQQPGKLITSVHYLTPQSNIFEKHQWSQIMAQALFTYKQKYQRKICLHVLLHFTSESLRFMSFFLQQVHLGWICITAKQITLWLKYTLAYSNMPLWEHCTCLYQSLFVCLVFHSDLSTHTVHLLAFLLVLLCSSYSAHPRGVSSLQVHL